MRKTLSGMIGVVCFAMVFLGCGGGGGGGSDPVEPPPEDFSGIWTWNGFLNLTKWDCPDEITQHGMVFCEIETGTINQIDNFVSGTFEFGWNGNSCDTFPGSDVHTFTGTVQGSLLTGHSISQGLHYYFDAVISGNTITLVLREATIDGFAGSCELNVEYRLARN